MDKSTILRILQEEKVEVLRLVLTDLLGVPKSVEVPASRFAEALDGAVVFDGSSIEGFIREEENDVRLVPDLNSFGIISWEEPYKIARLVCDVVERTGEPFSGCPRGVLTRVVSRLAKKGVSVTMRPEIEFFLFDLTNGVPTTQAREAGGYFDLVPGDVGHRVRRTVVRRLGRLGIESDAAHHEVTAGQHEIDLAAADPNACADHIITTRFLVRQTAREFGLHGTFMPKPLYGKNGSGLHWFLRVTGPDGAGLAQGDGLTKLGSSVVAGILDHARGLSALTNPLVNSFKRLVPDHEAPTHAFWSRRNKNPLIRLVGDQIEFRLSDSACNPYLAAAALLASVLDGIQSGARAQASVDKDIARLSGREQARLRIHELPRNLSEALDWFSKDKLFREVLGDQIYKQYLKAKQAEWDEYIKQVTQWEVDRYLATY